MDRPIYDPASARECRVCGHREPHDPLYGCSAHPCGCTESDRYRADCESYMDWLEGQRKDQDERIAFLLVQHADFHDGLDRYAKQHAEDQKRAAELTERVESLSQHSVCTKCGWQGKTELSHFRGLDGFVCGNPNCWYMVRSPLSIVKRKFQEQIAALTAQRDRYKAQIDRYEEDEASVCPEDVGAVEYIRVLTAQLSAYRGKVVCDHECSPAECHWKPVKDEIQRQLRGKVVLSVEDAENWEFDASHHDDCQWLNGGDGCSCDLAGRCERLRAAIAAEKEVTDV